MGLTLQISLAPGDHRHAVEVLPHQLRCWAGQVDEVLLVVDLHRSAGRFGEQWDEGRPILDALIERLSAETTAVRRIEVDYSPETVRAIGSRYFGTAELPLKEWRGGPFYSYLFGIDAARHSYVLHLDSDLLFGGGGRTWVSEAITELERRPACFACNPLAGPPRDDGTIGQHAEPDEQLPFAFRFSQISTRIFLLDRRRLAELPLELSQLQGKKRFKADLLGTAPYPPLEDIITRAVRREGLYRLDFLGTQPGMWSLHPELRGSAFYSRLSDLVERVELGHVPPEQRGHYNLCDSFVDSSDARRAVARSRRLRMIRCAPRAPSTLVNALRR